MEVIQEIGSVKDRLTYLFNSKIITNRDQIRILLLDESHVHIIVDSDFFYLYDKISGLTGFLLKEFEKITIVDMGSKIVYCIDDILKPIDKKCIEELDIENIYR